MRQRMEIEGEVGCVEVVGRSEERREKESG